MGSLAHKPLKHYHRFRDYDYSRGAALFITISTEPRRRLFGEVENAAMKLSPFGEEVLQAIGFTVAKTPGVSLFGSVVMPDHVHFRIYLVPGHESDEAVVYVNKMVGRFKSYTTHLHQTKYGGSGVLWQEGFHDWICVSREMIEAVERYIAYNPLKWELRHNRGDLMMLHEPLFSPRLGNAEFWRGVGAIELLNDDRMMVSLRVSRKCSKGDIEELKARMLAKAGQLTVVSGFISPGEREVFDALLAEPSAKMIKVSPYALNHDYQPGVALMPAIDEGRLAVIARGNSPEEISRAACLDLNSRIIEIADKAAYALPGGVEWLK